MTKVALFCPRLEAEASEDWQRRAQACRSYVRAQSGVEALEFDTLEQLQDNYARLLFRRIVVAQGGYYPLDFHAWASQNRVDVLDVQSLHEPAERPAFSLPKRSRTRLLR